MKCQNCQKESLILTIIGKDSICNTCLKKNKYMGFILKTNSAVFHSLIKRIKPKNYKEYLKITKKKILSLIYSKIKKIFIPYN